MSSKVKKFRYNKPKKLRGSITGKQKDITGLKPVLKSKETSLFIDRPIQVYRCWFEYLKLCLEMEDLGLSLEMMERVKFDKRKVVSYSKYTTKGETGITRFRRFEEKIRRWKVKVNRKKYEGWDLDKVLTQSFNKWWNPHRHLFENKKTIEIKSPDKWVKKPYYRYIRVDTRKRYEDTRSEIDEILSDLKGEKKDELKTSTSRFNVIGKPRVDTLEVNRNIMIRFKNWEMNNKGKSRKQIVDEILEKEQCRMFGNPDISRRLRLTYPVLISVCEGNFVREIKLEEVGNLVNN
jgi:hypothetical protein|tara:strand:- start:122 stop:997 length:876 start_codon:yes stop_codon:yes gene_type:complete